MIGNRAGWIIAGTLLALESAGVLYALSFDAYSEPTALITPSLLAEISLPAEPPALLPKPGSANAAALYWDAINEYLKRPEEIETMIRDSDRAGLSRLAALDKVMAGASASGDSIFADRLDQIIAYGQPNALQAISRMGFATYRLGVLQGRRPPDRARAMEYYKAAFVLGKRLAHEKLTWREYDAGVGLLSEAGAAMMVELNKAPDRAADAAALQSFLDAQKAQRQSLLTFFETIYSNDAAAIATHAGDVFAFASASKETMWRVEAILKLGRLRFNVGTPPVPGNQRHANRLLRKLKSSDEPIIRKAADVASSLTVEQFRTLR